MDFSLGLWLMTTLDIIFQISKTTVTAQKIKYFVRKFRHSKLPISILPCAEPMSVDLTYHYEVVSMELLSMHNSRRALSTCYSA